MNRNEAVDSLKNVLCSSDFLFPNYFNIEAVDSTHSKIRIKAGKADCKLLREIARKMGYTTREENDELQIL